MPLPQHLKNVRNKFCGNSLLMIFFLYTPSVHMGKIIDVKHLYFLINKKKVTFLERSMLKV